MLQGSLEGRGCGPLVSWLVLPALWVDRSRSGVVPEHESLEVWKETCALIELGVSGVEPLVAFRGDECRRGGRSGGVVDSYHVRS